MTLAPPNAFYDMVPLVAGRAIVDLPRGRWLLSLRDQLAYGGNGEPPAGEPYALVEELTAEVELVPGTIAAFVPPDDRALPLQPTAEARTYSVVCRSSCADFDAWRQGALVGLWVLPRPRGAEPARREPRAALGRAAVGAFGTRGRHRGRRLSARAAGRSTAAESCANADGAGAAVGGVV